MPHLVICKLSSEQLLLFLQLMYTSNLPLRWLVVDNFWLFWFVNMLQEVVNHLANVLPQNSATVFEVPRMTSGTVQY